MTQATDIDRILKIPTKTIAPDLTDQFRRPNGKMRLREAQSQALYDASLAKGGIFPIGVGWGKTLISQLIGISMKAKRPLVLRSTVLARLSALWQAFYRAP